MEANIILLRNYLRIKKEEAFALFKEGKTALSPEVKDFRLRSKRGTLPPGKLKGIVRKL